MNALNLAALYGRRPRLLVVDDQPINIQLLYQIFHADHEVFMATGGEQALEVCRRESPDLVLLDVLMPDMDGLEVCRRFKLDPATRNIPVIFVTGQNAPEEESAGLEVGAVDFISKPINPRVVLARVNTHLTLKAQSDRLRDLAYIDGLTGVSNRRRFDERLIEDWRAGRRGQSALGVVLFDVDHFKAYNDHYGHQAGDVALQQVAARLSSGLRRPRDLLARFGGEEFVCLLPESDLQAAAQVAEHLRLAVTEAALPHAASDAAETITVSAGVAAMIPDQEEGAAERLLQQADKNLYRAKALGRNQVYAA